MAIQTLTGFSDSHKAAFRTWQANQYAFTGLAPSTLHYLEEDAAIKRDIAAWRAKNVEDERAAYAAAAKAVTPRTPPAPVAYATCATPPTSRDTWDVKAWVKANKNHAIPVGFWHAVVVAAATEHAALERKHAALEQKYVTLEQRLSAMEAQPKGLTHVGVWQRAATYARNEGVTHDGSTWCCLQDGSRAIEPGTSATDWLLIAKGAR